MLWKRLILNALKHWRTRQSRRIPYTELNEAHLRHLQTIPNREALLDCLPHQAVVAELGVFRGDFSKEILERTSPSVLHLIDSWEGLQSLKNLNAVQQRFQPELACGKISIHQERSVAALNQFPDHYFDWVYIDTDHSYPTTKAELHACARVVKADGWIAGHDYVTGNWDGGVRYGVVEAVNEFCVEHDWTIRYFTAETHRHLSFALQRLSHLSPLTSHL
ncbi:MAG: class I SAM-dependent methyltransferase [Saprospiraceae bacterium]|nr:class I SAM-dependent methyltransferase [Saprospiraceae bacterium]